MVPHINNVINPNRIIKLGKMPVESWLTPKPDLEDKLLVNAENYSAFIDANGCREYADNVRNFVQDNIDEKSVPLMIGVDHSMTGGVLEALSKMYGKEKLSLIVLDSHFDAIQTSIRYKLFTYLKEKKHPLLFSDDFYLRAGTYDPLAFERPDTYNRGSFLYYLIKDGVLLPTNLWVLGVQDYPTGEMLAQRDPLVKSYVDAYLNLERKGVNIIAKETFKEKTFTEKINKLATPFVYLSFDVDVGCGSAITMTRCLPHEKGLSEYEIYNLIKAVKEVMSKSKSLLVGLDVMEIDIHHYKPFDKSPIIITNVIKQLCKLCKMLPSG
jgi:arginase family enzyme